MIKSTIAWSFTDKRCFAKNMTGKKERKEKRRKFYQALQTELRENRKTFLVYSILRILVIVMMVLQLFNRNYENAFLCVLTLALMIVPSALQVTFKVEFPSTLEIIILLFIFAAEILGEISSFYIYFPNWDTILHTLNGFLCAALGVSLVEILNRDKRIPFQLSPFFLAVVSFCFSMTIGVLWEFFEFGMDMLFCLDMQKDTVIQQISSTYLDPTKTNARVVISGITQTMVNGQVLDINGYLDIGLIDTMEDLLVNFVGALVFALLQFVAGKHGDKRIFRHLVPSLQEEGKYNNGQTESKDSKNPADRSGS